METNILGVGVSFLYVGLVLMGATLIQKKWQLQEEFSRKSVHILLGNWVFIAFIYYTSAVWASVVPAIFVVVNYVSAKKGTIQVMEREENQSLGTVWYAVSLLVLTVAAFYLDRPYMAIGGILTMAYGDGLAAVVGTKWGNTTIPGKFEKKSLEGSLTAFTVIALITGILAWLYLPVNPFLVAFVCGTIGSLLEFFTPNGYDNLSLPIGIGFLLYILSL